LKVNLHYFSKKKVKKKSQTSRNQGFSYYFCLMIEKHVDPDPDPQHCLVYAPICVTSSNFLFFVQALVPGFVYLLVVVAVGAGAGVMYTSRHQDRNKTPAESW
jgi:hypothetical protein